MLYSLTLFERGACNGMPSFLVGAPPCQVDPLRRLARKRARRVLAPSAKSSGGGCGDIQMNLYLCVRYG